jgi:hypothetical protein
MTDVLFEVAKTIGSASGIFAAAFLVWDRYVKHFPTAIIVARPLVEGSQHISQFLLVKNISDRPILISWNDGETRSLRLARDQSSRGIIQSLVGDTTIISLGSGVEVCLPLFRPRDYEAIDPDNSLAVC